MPALSIYVRKCPIGVMREIAPIYSAHGAPVQSARVNVSPGREVESRGSWATVPYEPMRPVDRSKHCKGQKANGELCGAYRTKDSDFCAGHNKSIAKGGDDESAATA